MHEEVVGIIKAELVCLLKNGYGFLADFFERAKNLRTDRELPVSSAVPTNNEANLAVVVCVDEEMNVNIRTTFEREV